MGKKTQNIKAKKASPVKLKAKVAATNVPPAQLMDMVSAFLADNKFKTAHAEFEKQRVKNGWQKAKKSKDEKKEHHSLVSVFETWQTSLSTPEEGTSATTKIADITKVSSDSEDSSSGSSSSSSSSEDEGDVEMADAESDGDADTETSSSSSSSSSSDSDSDDESEEEEAAPVVATTPNPLKRKAPESDEESSSDSSSSESGSSSDEDAAEKHKVKKVKVVQQQQTASSSSSESDSSSVSSDSTSDEDSDDEAESESESEESSEETSSEESSSDESSESEEEGEKEAKAAAKIPLPESDSDSESSSDSSTSDSDADQVKMEKQTHHAENTASDTSATLDKTSPDFAPASKFPPLPPDPRVTANNRGKAGEKKANEPFSRIRKDINVDPRLASNAYQPYDYAQRAHEDLIVTKGRGFTKEKNKKKRGSYKGGMIDISGGKGIKFED